MKARKYKLLTKARGLNVLQDFTVTPAWYLARVFIDALTKTVRKCMITTHAYGHFARDLIAKITYKKSLVRKDIL